MVVGSVDGPQVQGGGGGGGFFVIEGEESQVCKRVFPRDRMEFNLACQQGKSTRVRGRSGHPRLSYVGMGSGETGRSTCSEADTTKPSCEEA